MKIKLVILLACLCCTLWSQEVPSRQFSVHDGLIGQQINCLYEDSRAYLWVGTRLGLSKFNGETFETFGVKDGLPHQYICGINEDDKGNIVVVTRKGVAFYDGASWESIDFGKDEVLGAVSFNANNRDSIIIIQGNRCFKVSGKYPSLLTEYPLRKPDNPNQFVKNLVFNEFDQLIIIFQEGTKLSVFNSATGVEFSLNIPMLEDYLPLQQVLTKSKRKYFYLEQQGLLEVYELTSYGLIPVVKSKSGILVQNCLVSDTIFLFNIENVFEIRPNDRNIRVVLEYGNVNPNINTISIKEYAFLHSYEYLTQYQPGPFTNYTQFRSSWSVTRDKKGNIWIGSYSQRNLHCIKPGGEIEQFDSKFILKGLSELFPNMSSELIHFYNGSSCNERNEVFFPMLGGVMKLANGRATSLFGSETVNTLFSYYDGTRDQMVFGIGGGIRILPPQGDFHHIDTTDGIHLCSYIVSIAEDRKSRYWLGSFNGLTLFDPNQMKVVKNFYSSDPNTKVKGGVVCMTRDYEDHLWFGTAGGLALLDEQADTLIPVGRREMPIYCSSIIAIDSAYLLIATSDGLYRFNAQEYLNSGQIQYTLYNETNGFVGIDPHQNAIDKDMDGNIWIGCVDMVVKVEPDKFDDKHTFLKTIIRQINDIPISFQQQDSKDPLAFTDNNIRIYFEAVGTSRPNTTLYSYQLEGYDMEWSKFQSFSNASYNRVPNGNYRFCVRAQGNSVGEHENPCVCVPIYVQASFFQNAHFHYYAIALIFIISLILILLIYFYQLSIRKRQEKEQESTLLRINTLQAQMNPHFVFNVFSSLQHLILTHNIDVANEYLGDFGKMVRQFLNASVLAGRQGTTTSKESDILLSDELELITSYIRFEQLNYQDRFEFFLKVDDVALKEISIPPMIIQPFVENAIKHGLLYLENEKGLLTLLIKKHPNQSISIILIDNGVGRAESMRLQEKSIRTHRSHGTKLVMDRVKVLNKLGYHIAILIENNHPRGTIVTINFMPD